MLTLPKKSRRARRDELWGFLQTRPPTYAVRIPVWLRLGCLSIRVAAVDLRANDSTVYADIRTGEQGHWFRIAAASDDVFHVGDRTSFRVTGRMGDPGIVMVQTDAPPPVALKTDAGETLQRFF